MPLDQHIRSETREIHCGKESDYMALATALSTIQMTVCFEGEHHRRDGDLPPLPLPSISQEDFQLNEYLEYLYAAQALYICKHPCFLRDSNPGHMKQQLT
ncbi:hypothetical protein TNCV_1836701 [Trichonephila clavipes]|nr:hypothetical protein TNCV_1836701 [Trichonephila clavipes]